MIRSFDPSFVNSLINSAEIYPWVACRVPRGQLDMSALVADENNFLFECEGGAIFLQWIGDGIYEGHWQFRPEFRGPKALAAAIEVRDEMFAHHGARCIVCIVPENNLGSRIMTRALHARATGRVHKNAAVSPVGMVDGIEYVIEANNGH